jgi:hypothetical protein
MKLNLLVFFFQVESICFFYCVTKFSDIFGYLILTFERYHDQNSLFKMLHDFITIFTGNLILLLGIEFHFFVFFFVSYCD